jgi:hypothetical protein
MGWFILFIIIAIAIAISIAKETTQKKAKDAYQVSLSQLKKDPANSNLRQKTLSLGRTYSNLMRDKKGITIFDEMALMNDINAACAATSQMTASYSQATNQASIEERLTQLQNLREKGLINEDDFARRKREIMDQL